MIEKLTVTIVVNNFLDESKFWAEHGLSLLINFSSHGIEKKILLDTGQSGDILVHNLETLKANLDNLMAIVISHGHYDHTGGLLTLLRSLRRNTPVIVHPEVWGPRLNKKPYFRTISSGLKSSDIESAGGEVIEVANPVFLTKEILTTGTIERVEPFERNDSLLRVFNQQLLNDDILDDQSLIINLGEQGLFLVTGCCHAGIINTVKHAQKITGNSKINGIIGGLHLVDASEKRLKKTSEYLRKISPQMIIPLHCSGLEESFYLRQMVGDNVKFLGAGEEISIM